MINPPTLLHYICRSTAARSVVFPARSPPALSWVTLLTCVRECSALLPTILLSVLLVCRCRQLHGLLNNTTSKCLTRLLKPTIVLEPHPGAFTNIPNPRRHQPPDTRVQRACLRFHKVRHRLPRGIPTTTGEPSRPLPLPGWHLITAPVPQPTTTVISRVLPSESRPGSRSSGRAMVPLSAPHSLHLS